MMTLPPAVISGLCAAFASLFGKLSGVDYEFLDDKVVYILKLGSFCTMVVLNGVMWTFFVKALQASNSSLQPTVLSSATNYFFSGILGFLIFKETTGVLWWAGISLVLIGLLLITSRKEVKTE